MIEPMHEVLSYNAVRRYTFWLLLTILAIGITGCDLFNPVPPSITTNVSASDGALSGRVQVSWDPHPDADSYKVHRSTTADGAYSEIASVTAPGFDDSDVVEGIVYWYEVQACNKAGCGETSLPVAGYVQPEPPPPPS